MRWTDCRTFEIYPFLDNYMVVVDRFKAARFDIQGDLFKAVRRLNHRVHRLFPFEIFSGIQQESEKQGDSNQAGNCKNEDIGDLIGRKR
jgi:hypothetical protein